jgi:hypothetical protein
MGTPFQVTFDAADPERLAAFWGTALGYREEPPPDGYDSWEQWAAEHGIPESEWERSRALVDPDGRGPRLYFQQVPEPKTAKNRVHLDVNVGGPRGSPLFERRNRVHAEADRLAGEGATKVRVVDEHGEFWIVMTDPEGNEFCLQ